MGSTRASPPSPSRLTANSRPRTNFSSRTLRSKERAETMARGSSAASATKLMPIADPWAAGLTTTGRPSSWAMMSSVSLAPSSRNAASLKAWNGGVGMPSAQQQVLGEHLVHALDAGQHPRTRVRQAQDLQQLLHRAVLAALAVHGDEDAVGPRLHQATHQRLVYVDAGDPVPPRLQRPDDPPPGAHRDVPLQGASPVEHAHVAAAHAHPPPRPARSARRDVVARPHHNPRAR